MVSECFGKLRSDSYMLVTIMDEYLSRPVARAGDIEEISIEPMK